MVSWGTTNTEPEMRTIDAGSFWPSLESGDFYDAYSIPAELPAVTVIGHLRRSIVCVRHALDDWRVEQESLGYATLTDVPQESVDGEGELSLLWARAVFCDAKAELLKETATLSRREVAENAAKSGEDTEEKYREFSQDAIRAIYGMDRISIELI
jgi:hypothetical protein